MDNKKILIVTYYWFPFTGTGVYRISKFVKYLKLSGWEPIILTAKKSTGNLVESEVEEIYRQIPVYRTLIFEPTEFIQSKNTDGSKHAISPSVFYQSKKNWKQRLAIWTRLNVLIPDAKISWRFFAISKGKEVIRREKPALILSTSPPPTAHLVAKKLARWSKLPWIADFRDPWTNIYYYDDVRMNPGAEKINRKLERSVLGEANHITMVNDGFFPEYDLAHKATKIPNGFDRDDFPGVPPSSVNKKFTICYIGSLKMNQYPDNFIAALKRLSENEPEIARQIALRFFGHIDSRFRQELEQQDILCEATFPGLVSHKEAIYEMARADMQLLLIGKNPRSKPVLSTKVFEYMMSGRPILGIGPLDGSAAKVIEETKTGFFFDHSDVNGVKKCITEAYYAWSKNGNLISPDTENIEKYNFKNLVLQLDRVLKSAIHKE